MKKTLQFFAAFVVFTFCVNIQLVAQATTPVSMSADLSYSWVGADSLMISYKYFRDCRDTISSPATVNLNYQAQSCHAGGTITLTKVSEISGQAYCQTGTCIIKLNHKESFYTGILVLPTPCSSWELSITNGIRMADNLIHSGSNFLYTNLILNNTGGVKNQLPTFPVSQVFYTCDRSSSAYNSNFFDHEGDSLAYSLVAPLNAANTAVVFASGYSASSPLGTGSTINVVTFANVSFYINTTLPVNSTLALRIKIKEFRNINGLRQLIGETNKDILVVIKDCPNTYCAPALTSAQQHINTTFEIPADTTTCLDFTLQHNCDTAAFALRYDTVQTQSGATIYYNGNQVRFCWRPDVSKVSGYPYQFGIIKSLIPKCGPNGMLYETIYVRVFSPVISGLPDEEHKITGFAATPNPFSQQVTFTFFADKPKQDQELVVLNLLGQEVGRVAVQNLTVGKNSVTWSGGEKLAPGIYSARFKSKSMEQPAAIRIIKLP